MSDVRNHAPDVVVTTDSASSLGARIERFFFQEERPVGLASVRVFSTLVMLIPTLHRIFRVRELFSQEGCPTPLWENYGQPDLLPIPSSPVASGLYALLTLSLVTSCVGWRTRMSLLIAGVLTGYISMLDSIGTMTKFSVVATHLFLLLSVSSCGRIWSVDRWLAARRGADWSENGSAWPRRLLQILVGVIYLGAAATKMHTPVFFTGDQLRFWLLTNVNAHNPLGESLSQYPGLILPMVYITIVWEVLFLFNSWKGVGRVINLSLGILFHTMTFFTLGLLVFPLVYFSLYFAWYEEADHQRWISRWRGWFGYDFRRANTTPVASTGAGSFGLRSLIAWGGLAGVLVAGGVWYDHGSDPFREHRLEGRIALSPIEDHRLEELLRNDQQLDVSDKIFSVDIGSVLFNDNLVDRRQSFQRGESAVLQCSLLPPHEDLYLEVHLCTESGQIMRRHWQVVARENLRGHFWLSMDDALPSGVYDVVVKINGAEAARRTLELLPEEDADALSSIPSHSPAASQGTLAVQQIQP